MPVFVYKAIDSQRRHAPAVGGTVAADSPRQARQQLRARGLTVQEIVEHSAKRSASFSLRRRSGRHSGKLPSAIREIATLLGAGISLVDAMTTVAEQHRGDFRSSLLLLRERVSAGIGLAEAMAEQPDVFDPLCIHMAEVGENAGTLETVLDQWAEFKERSLSLKDRVITALLYPTFVMVIGLGVVLFLMTFVIPMLLENIVDAGRPLPWPTQIVKGISDLLVGHGWLIAIVAGLAITAGAAALRTPTGRRAWHRTLLRVPLIGPMARKQAIARIAMVIATLMRSGVEFLRALDVTGRSVGNTLISDALEQVGREVAAGQDIGRALQRTGVFPALAIQIFTVGQESGRLEEMLDRLASDYDRQVTRLSERLTAALEPILIVTLAVFVGFILMATVLPILEAGNVI
jgi:type II secretory pathway component PulF